jgi:hypothetical protein
MPPKFTKIEEVTGVKYIVPDGLKLIPMTDDETTLPLKNGHLQLCKVVRADILDKQS